MDFMFDGLSEKVEAGNFAKEMEFILDEEGVLCIPLHVGLNIEVREDIYEELKNDPDIQEKFKLNVKRLNRWWYSIYFDKKEET